jgi:hypothetical protein
MLQGVSIFESFIHVQCCSHLNCCILCTLLIPNSKNQVCLFAFIHLLLVALGTWRKMYFTGEAGHHSSAVWSFLGLNDCDLGRLVSYLAKDRIARITGFQFLLSLYTKNDELYLSRVTAKQCVSHDITLRIFLRYRQRRDSSVGVATCYGL